MINVKDCFEKGLLKKAQSSLDLAKKSLKQADFFLDETYDLIEMEKKQIAVLSLYNAFFHAVRSLLFKDGVKERSHYCVARYMEELYCNNKIIDVMFLNAFETVMSIRHNVQYSTEIVEIEEDLDELYNLCEELISKLNEIIKKEV